MKAPSVELIRQKRRLKSGREVEYWRLRWPGKDGRMRTENIGRCDEISEREAGRKRRKKIADLDSGKALRDPSGLTLKRFLDLDRDAIRTDAELATIRAHEIAGQHAIDAIGEDVLIDRIGWAEVTALKNRLSAEHTINGRTKPACSKATIAKVLTTLKAAWNRATRRGLVVSNPFVGEGVGKVQAKQKRIYTAEEVDAMIAVAPNAWWQTFIRLAFTTGLRLGEIVNLTWTDLDFKAGTATVSAKRAGTFRVGEAEYPVLPWSAKSHHERTVPLCEDMVDLFKRMQIRAGGSRYVFLSLDRLAALGAKRQAGKLPQPAHWVNNALRDFKTIQQHARAAIAEQRKVALEKVEWRTGSIHDLRKSFGSHAAARGIPMRELQAHMGHSSITVTAQFYVEVEASAADRLRAAFTATA